MKWKIEVYGEIGPENAVWLKLEKLESRRYAHGNTMVQEIQKEDMQVGESAVGFFRSSGTSVVDIVRTE